MVVTTGELGEEVCGSSFGGLDQVMEPAGIWERSSRACGRNDDEERVQ